MAKQGLLLGIPQPRLHGHMLASALCFARVLSKTAGRVGNPACCLFALEVPAQLLLSVYRHLFKKSFCWKVETSLHLPAGTAGTARFQVSPAFPGASP